METKTKWIIGGLVGATLIGGVVLYFKVFKKTDETDDSNTGGGDTLSGGGSTGTSGGGSSTGGGTSTNINIPENLSNLKLVKSNLGGGTAVKYDDKLKELSYTYLDGKNKVVFYSNNRMTVVGTGSGVKAAKGSYTNGGKSITMDNGKKYENSDIFQNLSNIRKAYNW